MSSPLIDATRAYLKEHAAPPTLAERMASVIVKRNAFTMQSFMKDGVPACANFSDELYVAAEELVARFSPATRRRIIRQGRSASKLYADVFANSRQVYKRLHGKDRHDFAVVMVIIAAYNEVRPGDPLAAVNAEYFG